MDELWTIRPVKSSTGWTMRPVLNWQRFGTMRPMSRYPDKVAFRVELKNRLKRFREKTYKKDGAKMTQDDMADALGVQRETYPKYEQPKADKNLPMYLLPKVCDILKRHPWEMLTGESPAQAPGKAKKA